MKNLDQRNQIIEYSIKLNSTNLSPLRSGNISLRGKEDDKDGYLITPSGKKYETLKPEDIVFMGFNDDEEKNDLNNKPSSEWRFHRDIYVNKKRHMLLFMLILHTQQLYLRMENQFHHFII